MTYVLHLDRATPNLAEVAGEGGNGNWRLPGGAEAADDVAKWRALAEAVAVENGFRVVEWRTKPSGGEFALLRRWKQPNPAQVLDAVKAALAPFGLTIGETWETPRGTMRVEVVPD